MNHEKYIRSAEEWFAGQQWTPFAFQKQTWEAFLKKKNGLLHAPTGSGKTYALWIPIVLEQMQEQSAKIQRTKGLKALWITPLRALSLEIEQSAKRFVREIDSTLTVGVRTGDTAQKARADQKKNMPDLLITTPESLQLLLASKGYRTIFKNLLAVVIDEWHELLGTKRGVQIELALSRLKVVAPKMRIWGISATIGNLEQAREVLLGPGSPELSNSVLISAMIRKKIDVHSIIPEHMSRFPWRGHLGLHLLNHLIPILRKSRTTLIFTNTRSQCEIWFQRILERYPEFAGELAMHHGSIDRETRLWVEQAIRNGRLKAVVATSSLDLGVDFAPVETIVQIGGPKGVARFLQRAGRSGHRPGERSVIYFLPTHAMELIEASALQKAVRHKLVEDRLPYLLSFDVLVQYLVTLAVSDGFFPDRLLPEIRSTFCFREMSLPQWEWVLNFISKGAQSLMAYDEYKKVSIGSTGKFHVADRSIALRHRLQIGTIVSDAMLIVKYRKGGYIGSIEESFISKLNPGDVFTFAGKKLELCQITNMQVLVKKSDRKDSRFPSWAGGRMSFSAQMSEGLRKEIHNVAMKNYWSRELRALSEIFERQSTESIVPGEKEFLIESFQTREGHHAIFYPFEGRFVHEAMAGLLGYRLGLIGPITLSLAFNDYGFELVSDQPIDIQAVIDNNLFSAQYLMEDLHKSLNMTEMAKRKFRDISVISGMVLTGFPSRSVKTKHLQSNSQLLFKVFRDYEPENLLYQQAFLETFEHQLQEGRLRLALERIDEQDIIWKRCSRPTPFGFPIMTDRLRDKMSSEKLEDRIQKMIKQWERIE